MAGAQRYRLDEEGDEISDLESPGVRQRFFAPPPGMAPPAPQHQAYAPQPAAEPAQATAGLSDEEFSRQWLMGLAGERSLGRPKEWNGKEDGFDTFAFRFSNWLGAMPGNAEELLEASTKRDTPILVGEFGFRAAVIAKGVMQALRSLVDGKALDIVKSVSEKGNGFEAWRRLWREYRPHTAGRKVTMLEAVMEDRPRDGEDFGTWYHRWMELIRQAEVARGRLIDDDVKVAVAMRRAPRELRDHLMLQSATIGDRFSVMGDIIATWMIAKKSYQLPREPAPKDNPNAMEIGAMSTPWQPYGKGFGKSGKGGKSYGKGDGKSYGKGGKSYGKGDGKYGKSHGKSHGKGDGKFGKSYGKGGKSYGKSEGKYGKGTSNFMSEAFHGYCGGCWEWGHKKAHCPSRSSRMEIGALTGSTASGSSTVPRPPSTFSDPGTSVSHRIQAVSSSPGFESWDEEDWPDDETGWWHEEWTDPSWDGWAEHHGGHEHWQHDEAWEHQDEEMYIMTLRESTKDEPHKRLVDTPDGDGVWTFMIDSGSQSTACQPEFATQYGIDDSEVAKLRDIQDRLIPAYGKKVVDVEFLGGPSEAIVGSLKLDVSEVGKNVASMGRLLRAGFDLHFTRGGHDCWMEQNGQRIQINEDSYESEAPLYSLKLKVREPPPSRPFPWPADRLLVAPVSVDLAASGIVGCSVELAGLANFPGMNGKRGRVTRIRDDRGDEDWLVVQIAGEGSVNVRPINVKRLDQPVAEAPAASDAAARMPVVLRAPGELPSRAVVESHNLTHLPTAPWCEICIAAKAGMDHFHTAVSERTLPEVQADYFYLSATGELCDEQAAKATFLSMIDVEQGYVAALQVQKKGDEPFAVRFLASFLDRMRCDEVKLKYDNEPGMKQLAHMVRTFRSPRKTTLEPIIRAEHEMLGAAERAHRTLGANARAMVLDLKARTAEQVIPGHVLFPWLMRHVGWSITRFQPHGTRGHTSFEMRTGTAYKSALVNFAETVMIRVPIDPPGLRRKLDTQWLKGTWVGRTDESDAHIVLTSHGVVTGRSVRRLPPELRFQVDLVRSLRAKVSDPVLSQAKLLRILPTSMPIRLDGETEALEEAADVGAAEAAPMAVEPLVNEDAADAVEMLPASAIDMDVGAEELLGDAMATEDPEEHEPPTRRQRIAAIVHSEEHPTTDGEHYQIPKLRTDESIVATRADHIKYLLESKSVKDVPRATALETGAKILSGRFVDDDVKEKSRYCAREFATTKDPTVFAAASDVDATACVDLYAVKHDFPTLCFDAVAAFSQADEQELVFLECPREHLEKVQQDIVWQCLKVREGRRSGARSWQEHFLAMLTDAACPGAFAQNAKSPSLYYSASLKVLLDLHVDDGYASGPPESLETVFGYLSTVLVLKISPLVKYGMAFDHVGTTRYRTSEGMWIQTHDKYVEKVLDMLGMTNCNASTSPKLDKAHMDDDDQPCEKAALYRTAVCTLLYASKRKPEIQSTIRWLCKRLKSPDLKSWRQLVKLARYMKGSRHLCTFFPRSGEVTHIAGFLDGDWACDDFDRKSVSGAIAMVAGCRMHNHSRGTGDHALSSGESEIMSASEMLKECLLLQYNLQFAGFGLVPIVLHTDATVCRQFVHRKGVGRMKHLDVRHCWLQEQLAKGAYTMKKVPREFNPSDMMTHAPSAAELQKFLPMVGIFERACADGPVELVKTALAARPSSSLKLAAAVLACMAQQTKSETCPAVMNHYSVPLRGDADWQLILLLFSCVAILFLIIGLVAGWKLRAWWSDLVAPAASTIAPAPRAAPALAIADAPRSAQGLVAVARPTTLATKSTQSQTRFTYWTVNPRFVPLPEREHGCWELAR